MLEGIWQFSHALYKLHPGILFACQPGLCFALAFRKEKMRKLQGGGLFLSGFLDFLRVFFFEFIDILFIDLG